MKKQRAYIYIYFYALKKNNKIDMWKKWVSAGSVGMFLMTCCLRPCYKKKQDEINKKWFSMVTRTGYEPCATTEEYV